MISLANKLSMLNDKNASHTELSIFDGGQILSLLVMKLNLSLKL